jgi:hypothetical protein
VGSPSAAASKPSGKGGNVKKKSFHNFTTTRSAKDGTPILASLKRNSLEFNAKKTIGEAFDSYKFAIKKEWRETPPSTNDSPYFIDYLCWFAVEKDFFSVIKSGVKERGLEIKFAIREDGETYIAMARRLVSRYDGKLEATPLLPSDIEKIVTAIYENREITF